MKWSKNCINRDAGFWNLINARLKLQGSFYEPAAEIVFDFIKQDSSLKASTMERDIPSFLQFCYIDIFLRFLDYVFSLVVHRCIFQGLMIYLIQYICPLDSYRKYKQVYLVNGQLNYSFGWSIYSISLGQLHLEAT